MSCDKVLLVSYKKNNKWNEVSKHSKKRFEEMGFSVERVEGYNIKENPEIKKTRLVYINFLERALKRASSFLNKNKSYKGVFIAEDDAWITVNLKELKKIVPLKSTGNIKWIGYQKKLKSRNIYYYVGTQLVWVPRGKIAKIKNVMNESIPQHLNGFLSKKIDDIGIDIITPGIVLEIEHESLTLGKVRPGKKIKGLNI